MMLRDKVALVTGGLSGIGASVVRRFMAEGAVAIAGDIAADDKQATSALRLDVADPASCAAAVAAVVRTHGRLDLMVNCAGIARDIPFLDTPVEVFDQLIAVNLRGSFLIGQACARLMEPGSAIVNIASVSGMRGNVGRSAYGASKGGVVTLSQVMAADLAPLGIRVNVIAPGLTETPMTLGRPGHIERGLDAVPLGELVSAMDVAALAVHLMTDEARSVTGSVFTIDGGRTAV